MKTALSIAGSDFGAGAGIQADIRTMNGVCIRTAITALTTQNTTGVSAIPRVTPEYPKKQTEAAAETIGKNSRASDRCTMLIQ